MAHTVEDLYGAWDVVSFRSVDTETGEGTHTYGRDFRGRIVFLPSGHMMVLQTAEARSTAVPSDESSAAAAFRTMMGYSGRYRLEGDKFVTTVDIAWLEGWVGSEQVRYFKIVGDELHIRSEPVRGAEGRLRHGENVWRRARK